MDVIQVNNLRKTFPIPDATRELVAVDGVSFGVRQGEIFGLLGPNGAGKTTTLEIIEGLQDATDGATTIKGMDTHRQRDAVKRIIGIQLQSSAYYEYLRLGEILELFGTFYGKRVKVDELLKIVDLTDKKKALTKELSGGQQQRFSICAALVNDPEIVFLDEPTTGLDPQARRLMWEFIKRVNERGTTVVLTTHYMEEAEYLCDRVGIMESGKIVALDTPRNLIRQISTSAHITFNSPSEIDLAALRAISGVQDATATDTVYELHVQKSSEALPQLLAWAKASQVELTDMEVASANLEDVFLELTGKQLREH